MPNFLGQHFLKNSAVINKVILALDIQSDETIIEIGPGHGELTIPLAAACEKIGAKIVAVEKDVKLIKELELRIEKAEIKNIEIVSADILEFLKTTELAKISGKKTNFKIAGNIPYYLTGHLLRVVSELEMKPERTVLMIQKEVAERLAAAPPKMNRLAASVQFWAEPKIIARVPRTDFTPPPEVDSAVITLESKKPQPKNADAYYTAVRMLFAQPRKMILNNIVANPSSTITKEQAIQALLKLDIDPKSRPQDLTIDNIAQIAQSF